MQDDAIVIPSIGTVFIELVESEFLWHSHTVSSHAVSCWSVQHYFILTVIKRSECVAGSQQVGVLPRPCYTVGYTPGGNIRPPHSPLCLSPSC